MKYTEQQLRGALARLIPTLVSFGNGILTYGAVYYPPNCWRYGGRVLDSELISICQQIRKQIKLTSTLLADSTWQEQMTEIVDFLISKGENYIN